MLRLNNNFKVAAICCTYKRPKELERSIECFLRQDYPKELRELMILDDAGQYNNQEGDGWRIISLPFRFRTLGEKRNASAALVSPEVEVYCVWDDDDVYLPWHISTCVSALVDSDYTIPTIVYENNRGELYTKENNHLYHGSWSFHRNIFNEVGGYPFMQSGQDKGLLERFKLANYNCSDTIQYNKYPSYIYNLFYSHSMHISKIGDNGYEKLEKEYVEHVQQLTPCWDIDWLAKISDISIEFPQ